MPEHKMQVVGGIRYRPEDMPEGQEPDKPARRRKTPATTPPKAGGATPPGGAGGQTGLGDAGGQNPSDDDTGGEGTGGGSAES